MPLLTAHNLHKTYRLKRTSVPVLRGVDLDIQPAECVTILGKSGSGKSTLLHLLAGLDAPDKSPKARITFDDKPLSSMRTGALDRYRNRSVGMVFQFYHLLPELNVLENAMLPAMMGANRLTLIRRLPELRERAADLLDRFGLSHRLRHRSNELSGGERQRVAIARALVNQPRLLLADEPTGNLDAATGNAILDTLMELRREQQLTMVIVTHDAAMSARADRTLRIADGVIQRAP